MDPMGLAGMLFTLILLAMVGGFILLLPIARRLGAFLEQRLQQRSPDQLLSNQIRGLESSLQALQQEVSLLSERQAFTESLLAEREPRLLPRDSSEP